MLSYNYECTNEECGAEFVHHKRISEPHLTVCPICSGTLQSIITSAPFMFMSREPTTIKQLAEHNSKKMGKYKVEDKERAITQERESSREARRQHLEANLPPGVQLVKNQEHKPWYGKLDKKIDLKSPTQVEKYIKDGK
jgi:putative FmdB family regulatory protein